MAEARNVDRTGRVPSVACAEMDRAVSRSGEKIPLFVQTRLILP